VSPEPAQRLSLLESLGYDTFDSFLWKGYLFLEESSAERIIKGFLIPVFFPGLEAKLKTIAASGVDDLEPRWRDFLRLFVFVHNTPLYKQKAWVIADGDDAGVGSIKELRAEFSDTWWPAEHFANFTKANFEEFYPEIFASEVSAALSIRDKQAKRKAKKELLDKVVVWAGTNKDEAKKEFQISAKEVIAKLAEIEKKLS
jgi:hypothetical protein